MTGSISVQFSLIAEDLFGSPAKLFIFFRDIFRARAHLYFELSIPLGRMQVFEIVFPKDLSRFPVAEFLRNRDRVA